MHAHRRHSTTAETKRPMTRSRIPPAGAGWLVTREYGSTPTYSPWPQERPGAVGQGVVFRGPPDRAGTRIRRAKALPLATKPLTDRKHGTAPRWRKVLAERTRIRSAIRYPGRWDSNQGSEFYADFSGAARCGRLVFRGDLSALSEGMGNRPRALARISPDGSFLADRDRLPQSVRDALGSSAGIHSAPSGRAIRWIFTQ